MIEATERIRFTADDLAGPLGRVLFETATDYLRSYTGSFAPLLDMRARGLAAWGMSAKQAAMVLNCKAADAEYLARRQAAPAAPVAAPTAVLGRPLANATYTLVGADGGHLTVKVEPHWKEGESDQVAKFLSGSDNDRDYTGFAFVTLTGQVRVWSRFKGSPAIDRYVAALQSLAGDEAAQRAAGFAYAVQSSRCCKCNRTLTVPASIHQGMGPDCARGDW